MQIASNFPVLNSMFFLDLVSNFRSQNGYILFTYLDHRIPEENSPIKISRLRIQNILIFIILN